MPLHDFRSVHLPYCLTRQAGGKYVVLNREYKPIGFKTEDRVDYDKYPVAVKIKGLTAKVVAKVSCEKGANLEKIYLYDDGCIPTKSAKNMQAYLERLEVLAKLRFG